MKIRAALLASVLSVGLVASASDAAPACNIVTDPAGDATTQDNALDIVSADLATNGREVAAVIRVTKLAETTAQSPTGLALDVRWLAPGYENPLMMRVTTNPLEEPNFTYGYVVGTSITELGQAIGTFDVDKNEVRFSTFIKNFAGQAKMNNGDKLTAITANGSSLIGTSTANLSLRQDAATTDKAYAAGTESCILKK